MSQVRLAEESVRRTELLDAAAYLFARYGFHATSMRELAKHLNIKAGSLYHHFTSKDQLLVEVCTIGMRQVVVNLDHAMTSARTIDAAITDILKGHIEITQQYGDYLGCYQNEHVHLPSDASAELRNGLATFHRNIERMFDQAIQRNELRRCLNTKTARLALIALLHQLARLGAEGSHMNLEALADELADLLINGLR